MTGRHGPDGVVGEVALRDADGFSTEALVHGVLVREDGCLYIGSGRHRFLPVLPRGRVGWDGVVLTFDGGEYRLGDEIFLGGGDAPPGPDATVPPACDRTVPTFLVGDPGE